MQLIPKMRKSFGERNLVTTGLVGTVVLAIAMFVALDLKALPFTDHGRHYTADFREAGAITPGGDVLVGGAKVGSVDSVRLDGAHVSVGFSITTGSVTVGDRSRAAIVTETVLGKAALSLTSAGDRHLPPGSTIPLDRTTSPYDVTSALADLTGEVGEIDMSALVKALATTAGTFSGTPSVLKDAVNGVGRISRTISSRDGQLQDLLSRTSSFTSVLSQHNAQVTALLTQGTSLLRQLNARHAEIDALLADATAIAQQIKALVNGAGAELKPALTQLNQVIGLLNRNKTKVQQTIEGLRSYIGGLGDAVSSGPFFDGFIGNLTAPGSLVPVVSGILGNLGGGSK